MTRSATGGWKQACRPCCAASRRRAGCSPHEGTALIDGIRARRRERSARAGGSRSGFRDRVATSVSRVADQADGCCAARPDTGCFRRGARGCERERAAARRDAGRTGRRARSLRVRASSGCRWRVLPVRVCAARPGSGSPSGGHAYSCRQGRRRVDDLPSRPSSCIASNAGSMRPASSGPVRGRSAMRLRLQLFCAASTARHHSTRAASSHRRMDVQHRERVRVWGVVWPAAAAAAYFFPTRGSRKPVSALGPHAIESRTDASAWRTSMCNATFRRSLTRSAPCSHAPRFPHVARPCATIPTRHAQWPK